MQTNDSGPDKGIDRIEPEHYCDECERGFLTREAYIAHDCDVEVVVDGGRVLEDDEFGDLRFNTHIQVRVNRLWTEPGVEYGSFKARGEDVHSKVVHSEGRMITVEDLSAGFPIVDTDGLEIVDSPRIATDGGEDLETRVSELEDRVDELERMLETTLDDIGESVEDIDRKTDILAEVHEVQVEEGDRDG
ncbi:MAG: hypothetical protein ABEJ58_05870 [Halodesulfurarchaeum sp.]